MIFRRFPDFAALLALSFVCALVFWPLLSGQTYYFGDVQMQFHPWAVFWQRALASGRIPLWNAEILGGAPFVGNPQIWMLYPSALLFLWMPAIPAIALATWLHLWLGGALFYGWMRRGQLQLTPLCALLGALVWMLCGFFVSKTQFLNMLQALAWVPALLWAGEALVARPRARGVLVVGALLALQLLAAHAQISALTIWMMVPYAFCLWRRDPERARGWRLLMSGALALGLAALLSLGQLLPVLEALGASQRQALSVFEASRFVVIPWALITLVAPHYYGNPMTGDWHYPRHVNVWESACYLGLTPLALGVLALWKERRARFWGAWSALFLWLSMGAWGGLWIVAYFCLPGLSRFHDAGRFGVGFAIGGAVLAALGARCLERRSWRLVALALLLTVFDLGIYARGFYPFRSNTQASQPPPALWGRDALIEARQARLWQPDYGEVWGVLAPPDDFRVGDVANARAYWQAGISNRNMMNGHLAEAGYDPLADRATKSRVKALGLREDSAVPPDFAARLGRSSIRIVQLFRTTPLPSSSGLTPVYISPWQAKSKRLYYYQNQRCLPRARFQDESNANWQMARIVSEDTRSIQLEVPTRARTVELADTNRPGWSAKVDGKPVSIEPTAEGFRRLQLPPLNAPATAATATTSAARRVRFEYAPTPWKLGVFVSLCALGFVSAGLTATRRR